jgi:hypothetical protein
MTMNWIQNMTKNTVENRLSMSKKWIIVLCTCHHLVHSCWHHSHQHHHTNHHTQTNHHHQSTNHHTHLQWTSSEWRNTMRNLRKKWRTTKTKRMSSNYFYNWHAHESRHSERQWKSFSKYVDFSLQTIVLLIVHNVFFDVTNSVKNQNSLKIIWNHVQKVNLKHIKKWLWVTILSNESKQWTVSISS